MIFHLSTHGHWSQFNANRNLQFGVRWLRKLYSVQIAQLWYTTAVRTAWLWNSSIVLQLNYEASWLCNSSAVKQPWSEAPFWFDSSALISSTCSALHASVLLCPALLYLFFSALVWQDIFNISSSLLKMCSLQSSVETENASWARGSWLT